MAAKIEMLLSPKQIQRAFEQLPKSERLRLIGILGRETWPDRFSRLTQRIRQGAKRYSPLSDDDIVRTCREVRQDLYERAHRRRRHCMDK